MHSPSRVLLLAAVLTLLSGPSGRAQQDAKPDDRVPAAVILSDSPEAALKKLAVSPGLEVDLWAAEPLLANPVALAFDGKGRAYVAETHRRRSSVPDIRKNMDWLLPVLRMRSVEDREAFFKATYAVGAGRKPTKDLSDRNEDGAFDWSDWGIESERVRWLEDQDQDGRAETGGVFAEGFSKATTGIAAGVVARGADVWLACVPDVWRLGGGGTPRATSRDAILTGFGVHVAYSGHDMHGLKFGPDGKLYWSIADCGARVTTKEGTVIDVADTGAIFRANPDGTEMEVVATGLRNPQSLAFNEVGDLFTGDNNADGGDKARWIHVVEGADYGWRIGWQFLPKLGAWNSERLWELDSAVTAPSILPPAGHIGHGPAGIAYYPGTGLPERYRDHFFYADFPGGVRSFGLKTQGATYSVENPGDVLLNNKPEEMTGKLLWNLYPSDVAFGPGGGLYVLDWIQGWEKTGKGRIFRVHDPEVDRGEDVARTRKALSAGMAGRADAELIGLLGDPDQRVRLEAQWELASRGPAAFPLLRKAIAPGSRLKRLHAIWALGQIGRTRPTVTGNVVADLLAGLLQDTDAEVRCQAIKVLGDARMVAVSKEAITLLGDKEPRVRFFAAGALRKMRTPKAVPALLAMLRENDGRDAFLRHAGAMALAACADEKTLVAAAQNAGKAESLAVLLALRRQRSPAVAQWLASHPAEAARAIHDEWIPSALPALAALAGTAEALHDPIVARRAINANFALGTREAANRLAKCAVEPLLSVSARTDALQALTDWNASLGRDRVVGMYREPLPGRVADAAATALAPVVVQLLNESDGGIATLAAKAAASLQIVAAESALYSTAVDDKARPAVRAASLRSLADLSSEKTEEAVRLTLKSQDKTVLEEARRLAAALSPHDALRFHVEALDSASLREKQAAFRGIGALPAGDADTVLAEWIDRLQGGQVPTAVQLDLLEAAALRQAPIVKQKLTAYEASRQGDPLAKWRECLEGGDAKAGREIFYEKAEAACLRCHKVQGEGGDVGPDMAGIGALHDRAYLLSAIVTPNATIAPGYDNVLLTLKDGNMVAGILTAENPDEVSVKQLADGNKVNVPTATIAERNKMPSAMPEGLAEVLGKRDLRHVIEYLASLKPVPKD